MLTNEQIILDHLVRQWRTERAPAMSEDDSFELFAAVQILKTYDELTYDEIDSGIVDGGNDGTIDSIYAFVNGRLISDDTGYDCLKRGVAIELVVVQSKNHGAFEETVVDKMRSTLTELLDLNIDLKALYHVYNPNLLRIVGYFRSAYNSLLKYFPSVSIKVFYVTKGEKPNSKVKQKAERTKKALDKLFPRANCEFNLVGARGLYDLASSSPTTSCSLPIASSVDEGNNSHVCLVQLPDYYSFISDPHSGKLLTWLFQENVRDFAGSNVVNRAIEETLQSTNSVDFWWLNNGITIVASQVMASGKTLTLRDPQVVNGFQTSRVIHSHFNSHQGTSDQRKVLIRVIETGDEAIQARIIKATNSQTSIPSVDLHATEDIQKLIEKAFSSHGLYYERKRNYYKNRGVAKDQIIGGITYLGQAIMAILLQRPDYARGRPSTLLDDPKEYAQAFSQDYHVNVYYNCARIMKTADIFLRTNMASFAWSDRNNVRFHLAMFAACVMAGKPKLDHVDVSNLNPDDFDPDFLSKCLKEVWETFAKLSTESASADRTAKGPDFVEALKARLRSRC